MFFNVVFYIEIRDWKFVFLVDYCNKDYLELIIFVNICFIVFVFFGIFGGCLIQKMVFQEEIGNCVNIIMLKVKNCFEYVIDYIWYLK